MQKVHCDGCGAAYDVDPARIPPGGMKMRCPACGASFHVQSDNSDDLLADLPAPASGGGLDLDLPALKSTDGGAPPGAFDADLPAPVGHADLPAPKAQRTGAARGVADLPAPKGVADLPAPKGVADLPAPKGGVDLPAPKAPMAGAPTLPKTPPSQASEASFEDMDLLAPKNTLGDLGGADLPAPKSTLGGDLPAPSADLDDAFGGVDLPAAKPSAPAPLADLPAPKASAPSPLADLPAPKGAKPAKLAPAFPANDANADLPALRPSAPKQPEPLADLPAPKAPTAAAKPKLAPDFDAPLDGGADLPAPKGGVARPALGGGVDLPAPKRQSSIPPRRSFGRPSDAPGAAPAQARMPKDSLAMDLGPAGESIPTAEPFAGGADPDLPALKSDAPPSADLPAPARKKAPAATTLGLGVDLPKPTRGDTMTTGKPPAALSQTQAATDPRLAEQLKQAKPAMDMGGVDLPAPAVSKKKGAPAATTLGLGAKMSKDSLDLPAAAVGRSDAPLAPPFEPSSPSVTPKDSLDLPTPAQAPAQAKRQVQGTAMGIGAPASVTPKDSLDLPAPADLPATIKGAPAGTAMGIGQAPDEPAGQAPAGTMPKDSLDLPAPANLPIAVQATDMGIGDIDGLGDPLPGTMPKDSLDLPAPANLPVAAQGAPQGTDMGIGHIEGLGDPDPTGGTLPKDSLDLPSPGALGGAGAVDDIGTAATDLGIGNQLSKDSLDLPSPGALGGGETDMGVGDRISLGATGPLPKPSGPAPAGGFDLGASLPKDSLDLPSPGALAGAAPSPDFGSTGVGLGAPDPALTNASLGDPLGTDSLELPDPGAGGLGSGTLGGGDFIPRSSLGGAPNGTVDLSAAELNDLKIESQPPGASLADGGGSLPLPEMSGANPLPAGVLDQTGAEDPFGDLGAPSAIPQPLRAPSADPGGGPSFPPGDTMGEDPFGSIAEEPAAPPDSSAAGGEHFGELDLGFGAEELEVGETPEMEALPPREPEPAPLDDTASVEEELLGGDEVPVPSSRRRKPVMSGGKGKVPPWAFLVGVLVVFMGTGVALGAATPYGYFGVYLVEQLLPAAGDPVKVRAAIDQAEARAQGDTYASVREALKVLSEARNEAGLNRELLARSLLHEGLYQLRFGEDTSSAQRTSAILARILDRGGEVPGLELARAAESARRGELSEATSYLQQSTLTDDAYHWLVAGEIALKQEKYPAAVQAFTSALGKGGNARAQWGLARALIGARQKDKAAAAVDATLRSSPRHGGALVSAAQFAMEAGELDRAHEFTRKATGRVVIDGGRARTSRMQRAEGWTLEGRIEELRDHTSGAHTAFEEALKAAPLSIPALLGSGRTLLRMARSRDALARFDSALSAKPSNKPAADGSVEVIDATVGAARALLSLERERDALARLGGLQPKFPEHPDLNLWLGRTYEALRESENAEKHYRLVMEKAPARFDGYLALSQLLFSLRRSTEAAKILEEAAGKVDDGPEVRRMLGHSELTRGRLDLAIEQFNTALKFDPKDGGALYGLARAQRKKGQIQKASRSLDRLKEADPTFPGLQLERGLLHEAQADYESAVVAYETALEARPHDLDLRLRLGAALVTAGNVDKADEMLRKVLKERPTSAEAEHFVGRVLFARHETDQALAHFERAVNLDITKADYHLYVAWASLEQGDLTRALEAVGTTIERDPSLGDAHWVLGRIQLRTGQVRDALDSLDTALRLKPGRHEARANMGEAYDQLRELKQAVRAYETAVQQVPEQGEWWYRLGRLHMDRGKADKANEALKQSVILGDQQEVPPRWLADAHRLYGDLLKRAGNDALALTNYERYLELAPDNAIDRGGVAKTVRRMKRKKR